MWFRNPGGMMDETRRRLMADWQLLDERLQRLLEAGEEDRASLLEQWSQQQPELVAQFGELWQQTSGLPPLFLPLQDQAMGTTRFGPYRVIGHLGSGGMGKVLLAERDDGRFAQRVAIKCLHNAAAEPELVERFLWEGRILAHMEHPGIARILDAGVAEDGTPYLVMEYVEGLPLTQHCDARGLSLRERVQLLVEICEIVEFTHRNLVIHRDLKPGNILVDSSGRPRLLDFGIAKLLAPLEARMQGQTAPEHAFFTPEIASPEQWRGEAPTPASDVFALGLLLYELLSSVHPRRRSALGQIIPPGALDAPKRASLAVARDLAPELRRHGAACRSLEPARWSAQLRGDLDAILAKATEPDPEQRYQRAEELARDLRAWLSCRPVLARQLVGWQVIWKWVRRHRLTSALLLLASSLILAITLTAGKAREQSRMADRQAALLVDLLARSARLEDPIAGFNPEQPQDLMRVTEQFCMENLSPYPDLQARVLLELATVAYHRGEYPTAMTYGSLAQKLLFGLGEPDLAQQIELLGRLSTYAAACGDRTRSIELSQQRLALVQARLPDDYARLASARNDLGNQLRYEGRYEQALVLHQAAEQACLALGSQDLELANTRHFTGKLLLILGRLTEAERALRSGLALRLANHGPVHPQVAHSHDALGQLHLRRGDLAAARFHFQNSDAIRTSIFPIGHPEHLSTLCNRGRLAFSSGDLPLAGSLFAQVLNFRTRNDGVDPFSAAEAWDFLARSALVEDNPTHACEAAFLAVCFREQAFPADSPTYLDPYLTFARAEMANGRLDSAQDLLQFLLPQLPAQAPVDPQLAGQLALLQAELLVRMGDRTGSLVWLDRAEWLLADQWLPNHPERLAMDQLAERLACQ
jgi:serine/threonine-protein kinase